MVEHQSSRKMNMLRFDLVFLALVSLCKAACYWPNGTVSPNSSSCVSDPSNPLSKVCCAPWDVCLPNGLCNNTDTGQYWRESCTNSDWRAGGCQTLCSMEGSMQNDIIVTPCDGTSTSGTWCCGEKADCCVDGSHIPSYTIAQRLGESILSSSRSSTLPLATATGFATPSSVSPPSRSVLTASAKAAVGASIGGSALIVAGFLIWKKGYWQSRKGIEATKTQDGLDSPTAAEAHRHPYIEHTGSDPLYAYLLADTAVNELSGNVAMELSSGTNLPHEMPIVEY